MHDATLLHELIALSAQRDSQATALTYGKHSLGYGELQDSISRFASGLIGLGLQRGERVAIYLEKRFETVIASFGAPAAGGVFVPLNPLLKSEQVAYILRDCNVRVLVTSPERLALLAPVLAACHDLRQVVVLDSDQPLPSDGGLSYCRWSDLLASPVRAGHRVIDTDMVAILYTSGSTGKPKGVVLSHRNMVAGAKSVASYLENRPGDTLLAALPAGSLEELLVLLLPHLLAALLELVLLHFLAASLAEIRHESPVLILVRALISADARERVPASRVPLFGCFPAADS